MKIAIISITENGRKKSEELYSIFENHIVKRYCFYSHCDENAEEFEKISVLTSSVFYEFELLIYVCACGIAVRAIAPYIVKKDSDPAVIVIDDCGKFVIPILSGHIGRANCAAEFIAEKTGSVPVITTATDIGKKLSPDTFAVINNLIIYDLNAAKKIASAVLDNRKIGLLCSYPMVNVPEEISMEQNCQEGIIISGENIPSPFCVTLRLVPKNIFIGIGCRKGIPPEVIERTVKKAFIAANISFDRICSAATVDAKKDEKGLLEFCKKYNLDLKIFTPDQLMSLSGKFTASSFVLKTIGADNVCERSAVLASEGNIIIKKYAENGVTVAAAEKPVLIDFERKIL